MSLRSQLIAVAHIYQGRLNLQMDSYFANNTRRACFCAAVQERHWRQSTPAIKMLNPCELLSRDVMAMRSVCIGSIHRAKICGCRSDTDLYYLLRRQSQVSHDFTFISQAHIASLKTRYAS